MPATKPKLPQLTTPVTGTFPSETIFSASTPLSARPLSCIDISSVKTPISPPTAYMDFLRSMSLNSPAVTPSRASPTSDDTNTESAPSTATSEQTDCSCKCEHQHTTLKGPATAPPIPPSPFSQMPMSAPPNGADSFPSLKIPPSPAVSMLDSPSLSARSPFSARSVQSVFDWDAALKARFAEKKKQNARTSVRHIREVVTRTVTYNPTPRMHPAPKGKRRKVEHAAAAAAST